MNRSQRIIKIPPFKVTVHDGATLTSQIEDGLRQAIATGFYSDGDFIPGYVDLAGRLGVSVQVVRRAIARLIADGLCQPRCGIGLRVSSKTPATVGNVLVVTGGDAAAYRYYMAKLVEHLRRHLAVNHLSMSRAIVACRNGREDFSELKNALNRHASLAIVIDTSPGKERLIRAAGVPYILMAPARMSRSVARYLVGDTAGNARTIAAHCSACGSRRVLIAGLGLKLGFHIVTDELGAAIRGLGMATRNVGLCHGDSDITTETLLRETVATFSRMSSSGSVVFDGFRPDTIVFTDDYVAQGALLAMTAAGIKIPDDVQVITMANKELGPVWLKPLTRFEVDAAFEAEALATLATRCLRDRSRQHTLTTCTTFIEGDTTRRRGRDTKMGDRRE